MSTPQLMVAFSIDFINGSSKSGVVAVPGTDPASACRATVGLIRGTSDAKYARPSCFGNILPHQVEDVSVTCLGPA